MRVPSTGRRITPGILGLVLLLAACPEPPEALAPVEFQAPAWQDGETSTYKVLRNDSVLFRSQTTLRYDEEFGQPLIEVVTTVQPVMAQEFFADSSTVVFRKDSLTPVRSARTVETDIAEFEVEARYEPGRVVINKQTIDGTECRTLKLPARSYDNEMFATLLRLVPLESGTRLKVNAVVPLDVRVVPVDVTVLGTKYITTATDSVICREIVLHTPSKEVRFWYELESPHRLIGMSDRDNDTELLLESYVPAGQDSAARAVSAGK